MYLLAHRTTDIACSQEHVFAYAADLHHFPEWFPGVLEITSDDGLSYSTPGKTYRETVSVPLRGRQLVRIQVIEVEPSRRLVTEGSLAALLPQMEIEVTALAPESSRVSWRMTSRVARGWSRWLVLPCARLVMGARAARALRRLKTRLETR